jgi:hypothetical protein
MGFEKTICAANKHSARHWLRHAKQENACLVLGIALIKKKDGLELVIYDGAIDLSATEMLEILREGVRLGERGQMNVEEY